jgi:NDP-sugar pyrophosphorylase family protein
MSGKVIVGTDCDVCANVKLTGPVVVGDGSVIGEDSVLENTVIWKNVRMEAGVRLKDSIIADNCRLGAGVSGENVVLADNVTVPANYHFEPGARVKPKPGVAVG